MVTNPKWARTIADKYITPAGDNPRAPDPANSKVSAIATLASFIACHRENEIFGGVRRDEAMKAFSIFCGIQPTTLQKIGRNEKL